jgi:DNA-binding transcriptional regulator YdaS (Cro superfamily)
MNLSTWLETEKGRSAALAAHFGKTPAAISQWKKNGVPVEHMKAVREFTSGAVTLDEMVPPMAELCECSAAAQTHAPAPPAATPPQKPTAEPEHASADDEPWGDRTDRRERADRRHWDRGHVRRRSGEKAEG